MFRPELQTLRGALSTCAAAVALAAAPCAGQAQAPDHQADTLRIADGLIVGNVDGGVTAFRGIPYAAPPIDSLRWRAPRPPNHWTAPLIANDYGPSCMQPLPVRGVAAGSRAGTVSEDCLTINVWTPAARRHPLPVMVWIYGGGNTDGTSGRTLYDGTHFANDSVVLVSFNYRLGVFGFFAHPALTREAGGAVMANFGLLDQLAALRWVRRNIAAFGGDTANITVFGESAGGQDLVALLTIPAARGLFAKAIAESPGGGWDELQTLEEAERDGARAATSVGLAGGDATAAQLRAVSAAALVPLAPELGSLVVDGQLLRERPLQAIADGHAAPVPLLIGTNNDEGSLIAGDEHPEALFPQRLDASRLDTLRALYGAAAATDAGFARALFRDGNFAGPVRWIADHDASAAPVYLYRFDYVVVPFRTARPGASHGSELPFIFENWPIPLMIPADVAMQQTMHQCWVAFARIGAPDCAGLPGWTRHQAGDGRLMLIDTDPGMRTDPAHAVLDQLQRWMKPRD